MARAILLALTLAASASALSFPRPRLAPKLAGAPKLRTSVRVATAAVDEPEAPKAVAAPAGSVSTGTINLVKSIVGAGVLSLPAGVGAFADSKAAVLPAAAILTALGAASAYSFSVLGRVCAAYDVDTYKDAWAKSVGEKSAWVVTACCTFTPALACLSYSIIMGDAFAALIAASSPGPGAMAALNALGGARRATIGALAVGALWPLCSLKSLAALAPTSALGTGGVLYTAGFMAKRCLDGTYAAGGRFAKECGVATFGDTLGFGSVNLGVYLAMCGTAYMAHFNAPSFFQDAGKKMKPYNAVIRNGFGLSILLNIAFMAAGFNTFGKGAKGLVLNNYATTDALAVVARALFGVSVVFTFPLAYNAVKTGLRGVARNMFAKTDAETLEKAVVGVPLALITAIALGVDDAGVVAALTGALMGSAVIYALPALMLLKGDKVAKAGWEKKIAPFAMLAMGAVGAVLGVVTL
ncbi:transmembrane amino acid transporter protein [Aureococcus anophagefferens]|nr:transmembrane amino acid transporter protein [Aureococcus anophagefferens]